MTESVWDYPRPPAVQAVGASVRVELGGRTLAAGDGALRVLETSHPPTVYMPPDEVDLSVLVPSEARPTVCEFKGVADYLDVELDGRRVPQVAWTFRAPVRGYEPLRDHVAFYPGRVDAAWLGGERVSAQEGDFYGGWITAEISGPFKGPPGTLGW